MGTYVDVASVRRTVGISSDEISDADVNAIIAECEPQVERFYNTSFTVKEKIDILDGNGTSRIFVRKNPILSVRDLKSDGTQEDPANLHWYRESGKIEINTQSGSQSISVFNNKKQTVVVKYLYGFLEESTTSTATDAASTAGTSVALSVDSETGFSTDDWVEIYGMDGNKEAAQVTGTGTGEITVDELVLAHESGSTVVKLQVSPIITKLMNIACAISMVARIVGESYTDTVGYGLGELNVQKGEPYTQWRETATQLQRERDRLMAAVKPRPAVLLA
jgi:uncharacterized protein YqfB (UPF0267 family)